MSLGVENTLTPNSGHGQRVDARAVNSEFGHLYTPLMDEYKITSATTALTADMSFSTTSAVGYTGMLVTFKGN